MNTHRSFVRSFGAGPAVAIVLAAFSLLPAFTPDTAQAQSSSKAREQASADLSTIQPLNTSVFRRQMQATAIRIPHDSLRVVQNVMRNGVNLLEVPLVEIITPTQTLTLELSVDPNPGLRCGRSGCAGVVRIGVIDATRPLERIELPNEMSIDLYGPDSVSPSPVLLNATRVLSPIRIQSRTQDVVLRVHPVGLPSVDVPLPVRTLQLRMSVASRTIDAWGLEHTELHLAALQGLDAGDTVDVSLQAAGVRVQPSVVRLTANTGAFAQIRSRSPGAGSITAQGPSYVQSAEASVQITWPWLFMVFTLIGGLIGAYFRQRYFGAQEARKDAVTRVIASALMGALLAFGLAVGINITGIALPGGFVSEVVGLVEAGIFATIADVVISTRRGKRDADPADKPPRREHQPA